MGRLPHVGADPRVCPCIVGRCFAWGQAGRHGSLPLHVAVVVSGWCSWLGLLLWRKEYSRTTVPPYHRTTEKCYSPPSLRATGVFRAATGVAAAPQRGANPPFATEGRKGWAFNTIKRSNTPIGMLLLGCTIEIVPYESSMTLAIFFSSFSTFGRTTVRMPFSTLAEILSRSTSSGSV